MKQVGAYEAKTHLPRLLREVAGGESIAITRHGATVALLVPPSGGSSSSDPAAAIDGWREFRKQRALNLGPGLSIRDLIEEGRRF